MSKRDKAEKEQELLQKRELRQATMLADLKKTKHLAREKARHYKYTDFPLLPILEVRDRREWQRKSHNKDKQEEEFIKFTYFKYQAPNWSINEIKYMFKEANKIKEDHIRYLGSSSETYHDGDYTKAIKNFLQTEKYFNSITTADLLSVTQKGAGFKELLNHCLTKKEIHVFLNSKRERVQEALLEAKLSNYNIDNRVLNFFLDKAETFNDYFKQYNFTVAYQFMVYCCKHNLGIDEVQELYDFVYSLHPFGRWTRKYRNSYEMMTDIDRREISSEDFFKRSPSTLIKLSNDWHLVQQNLKQNRFVQWEESIAPFEINSYTFTEITDNRALSQEGRKMSHCVGSYASRCVNGSARIVSMKHLGQSLITMEISNKDKIVQIRGKFNRQATVSEMNFIQKFAAERGLTLNYNLM